MASIKETMDVLTLAETAADFLLRALEDGRITAADLVKALPVLMALKDAVVGIQAAPSEWGDLDTSEWEALATKSLAVVGKYSKVAMLLMGQAA